MLLAGEGLYQLVYHYVYRLGLVDDGEGAARYHDEKYERSHPDESRRYRVEELVQRDGILLDVMESPRDEYLPPRLVRRGLELPRRHNVGEQRANDKYYEYQQIGVRHLHRKEAEYSLAFILHIVFSFSAGRLQARAVIRTRPSAGLRLHRLRACPSRKL